MNPKILLLSFVVFLSGCAGTGSVVYSPETIQGSSISSSPYSHREDAVGTLLDKAWNSMQEGDLSSASGWLSRAMRINPTEPAIYYHLAQVRKEQGQWEQARQLADRALSLEPESRLERRLQQLITSLNS